MNLIHKSMNGKVIETPNGRAIYADNFDENSHPKYRSWVDMSIREMVKESWLNLRLSGGGLATVYSDAWTKNRAARRVKPNEGICGVSALTWMFAALPAGNIADVLVCGKLFKGDKVIGGLENHGALTSGAGTATGSYGTYAVATDGMTLGAVDSAARFLAAVSFEAAGMTVIANTIALGYQYELTADLFVVCVNSVEAFATAGVVSGHMNIARD